MLPAKDPSGAVISPVSESIWVPVVVVKTSLPPKVPTFDVVYDPDPPVYPEPPINPTFTLYLLTLLSYFEDYCNNNKLNWQNIELLSIIQYITISSLYPDFHNGEYGRFLFLLGKYKLAKKLK